MKKNAGLMVAALGLALAFGVGSTQAQEHAHGAHQGTMQGSAMDQAEGAGHEMGEAPGHSHERCELHGGQVTMTKAHHFETVFAPAGVYLYMYSENQNPSLLEGVKATADVKRKDGTTSTLALQNLPLQKGEPAVYFCTMDPDVVTNAPGNCPKCGMKLVPQDRLFGKMDLSGVEPGSMKVTFHVSGLAGKEKQVDFTETFNGFAQPKEQGHMEGMQHMQGHEGMDHSGMHGMH